MGILNYLFAMPLIFGVTFVFLQQTETIHFVWEGHLGIYSLGGALLKDVAQPGIHLKIPFITKFYHVQVTLQTDQVVNIPCGTSSGVLIMFDKVEVVNRLKKELAWETIKNYTIHYDKTWIFDKIHHEINQFCSSHTLQDVLIDKFDILDEALKNALQNGCNQHAPGIEIIAVRVTKPRIPENIAANYENRELEKTRLLIAKQEQLVQEKVSETKKLLEVIQAEVKTEISKVNMQKEIIRKEGQKRIQELENQINYNRAQMVTNISDYRTRIQNEINKQKLSPQYMTEQAIQRISNNPKVYYGKSIPQYFKENLQLLNLYDKKNLAPTVQPIFQRKQTTDIQTDQENNDQQIPEQQKIDKFIGTCPEQSQDCQI